MRSFLLILITICSFLLPDANAQQRKFTHADTLRGTLSPERSWWDVTYYDLQIRVDPEEKSIVGVNAIFYRVLEPAQRLQIDLQEPMIIDKVIQDGESLSFTRDGNAWFVDLKAPQPKGKIRSLLVSYHGKPKEAKRAPWDGGVVWGKDSLGRPWIATACQGQGASIWWPNKDHQTEEPDSMRISVAVPKGLTNVSNGRLRSKKDDANAPNTTTFTWFVGNPINNYDVALNIGNYVHFSDQYNGENGKLDLDYWVLDYNLAKAKTHFQVVKPMMKCFEHWFGPYPFYKDSYKLVETSHLGMEHQSAVAYGNQYKMGYRGSDLSGTGWGMKWDFIIIHESGHEWFGNNITTKDIADMWVHEGFTNYSETIFTECQYGKEAGNAYLQGVRSRIGNDEPIIGPYGVNTEGSADMYYKGSNMLHTIRQVINNDETFRKILRGLNKTYYHQTVTSKEVEQYISKNGGHDFSKVFDQYLRHTKIPVLEYFILNKELKYRWVADVKDFDLPVKVTLTNGKYSFIYPTTEWKTAAIQLTDPSKFAVDKNFYIKTKAL
ncbi:M1 family peptidase [Chitinophaga sp. SYP-B3965]|uniref:M1 family metallopeptidase n=1 Tax=Chitinophaga sp. SYP-B3965 TaxID=2663120 RepID=UPI0012999206|nr:M1 family metallopeptidase [Chitinophaga sp. SYP-B3965]MRG44474.1 M1 family peptidase [Chitinophaga sp. SYP-B3965]